MSGYDQKCTVAEAGRPLFVGEPLWLPGHRAMMLPLNLTVGGLHAETVAHNGTTVLRVRGAGEFTVHRPLSAGAVPAQR